MATWNFQAEHVTVDVDVSSSVDIMRESGSRLDYVTANVSFIPRQDDLQSIVTISTEPDSKKVGEEYLFRWEAPVPSSVSFKISSRIRTTNRLYDIRKIVFPYSGFPDDVLEYIKATKTIDSDDPKVIARASALAAGNADYYSVVFTMADWTKENVKYDLSTLNVKSTNKASWVLARKDGVCDELSTLFIALLRAVGIPARFVAGIAYTEAPQFPENWGAHGWSEVYFPGTGWVPFDVTYGQYGYVDPTHIKLKQTADSADPDTRYEWLGKDVEISANPLVVDAELVKYEGNIGDVFDLELDVLQDRVGISSYNLVEATVKNARNSYASTFLYLSRINELEVDGNNYRALMLGPLETKRVYWIVKVIDNLDTHYTYTFPITLYDTMNNTASADFMVLPGATVFTHDEFETMVDAVEKEGDKVYSKKITIECSQRKEMYYVYDVPQVICTAKNEGNFPFTGLKFCFTDDCKTDDLGISQARSFVHDVSSPKPGVNKISFSVEGKDVSKSAFFDLDVLDEPDLIVSDVEYPSQIEFKTPYAFSFVLKKDSASLPQEVHLEFKVIGLEKAIEIGEMEGDKKFTFNLDSADLSLDPNIFTVSVNYKDLNGKLYTLAEEFEISLINVTFGQRTVIFLHDLDRWLRNLFK
ncbi:MAG: transglutaminase-like domain-containing protein [Candidatus Woesearchaeota archaeon]